MDRRPGCQGCWAIAPAVLGSGGHGRFAGLAGAALARGAVRPGDGPGLAPTLLQRLANTGQLQVTVVLLGDIELLGRAVRVADRQLVSLTGRDLRLVEVRDIHPDRLGSHRNSSLGPIGNWDRLHYFGQEQQSCGATEPPNLVWTCSATDGGAGGVCHLLQIPQADNPALREASPLALRSTRNRLREAMHPSRRRPDAGRRWPCPGRPEDPHAGRGLPSMPDAPSFIGLQAHTGAVAFRNIQLEAL